MIDSFTWKGVSFNNSSISIVLNNENFYFHENEEVMYDQVWEDFIARELIWKYWKAKVVLSQILDKKLFEIQRLLYYFFFQYNPYSQIKRNMLIFQAI